MEELSYPQLFSGAPAALGSLEHPNLLLSSCRHGPRQGFGDFPPSSFS